MRNLTIKPSLIDAAKVAAADDYEYLRDFVHPLPGWLVDYAAIRILDLLAWQEQNATRGPLFEIGIYHGRSLALTHAQPYGPKSGSSHLILFNSFRSRPRKRGSPPSPIPKASSGCRPHQPYVRAVNFCRS
jgi:hypothetical protein